MGLRSTFTDVRKWIRRFQNNSITEEILLQSNILHILKAFLSDENQPLRTLKEVPDDILEDLTILQRKWELGDLSILPQRGLLLSGAPDPNWAYKRSADHMGHGHLVNGQVWGRRTEMIRDGAHGVPIAGIYGTIEGGARSIVMGLHDLEKKEYYADIDEGDTIHYVGTPLTDDFGDREATNVKDKEHGTYRKDRITNNSRGDAPHQRYTLTLQILPHWRPGPGVPLIPSRRYRPDETSPRFPLRWALHRRGYGATQERKANLQI